MSAASGYPWWIGAAGLLGSGAIRALGSTWRVDVRGSDPVAAGRRCLFVFWHSRMIPLIHRHRGSGAAVLISRHRDGELVARVLHRLGYVTARGSSTRAGGAGALEMIAWAGRGRFLALTPDGPRGPAETLKPGAVMLASRTRLPVVPIATAAAPCVTLRSWDRMRIPAPFARLRVEYGEAIDVPAELDEDGLERWRSRIEQALGALTVRVRTEMREAP